MLKRLSNSPTYGPFLPQDFCRCNHFVPESKCTRTYAHTAMSQDSTQMSSLTIIPTRPLLQMDHSSFSLLHNSLQLSRCIITAYLYILPLTMSSMRKETILFISASLPSSIGPNKIGIKIYRLHKQRRTKGKEKDKGKKEKRDEESLLTIHLVCRYAEKKLMPSLIEYYPFKPPNPGPQAATLVLMAEFS